MAKKTKTYFVLPNDAPNDVTDMTTAVRDVVTGCLEEYSKGIGGLDRQAAVCVIAGTVASALSALMDLSDHLGQPWTNEKFYAVSKEIGVIISREVEAICNRADSHDQN